MVSMSTVNAPSATWRNKVFKSHSGLLNCCTFFLKSYEPARVKYGIKISKSIFQALKSDIFKRSFENQSKIVYTHRIQKLNEIFSFSN